MRGQETEQQRKQRDEVVVVQIGRTIDEFEIEETEQKNHRGDPVEKPGGDRQRRNRRAGDNRIHQAGGQRLDPREAGIGEVKGRFQVDGFHPAARKRAQHRHAHRDPEQDAERSERVQRDRSIQPVKKAGGVISRHQGRRR